MPRHGPDRARGLPARIDSLENTADIRQLVHRYALAVETSAGDSWISSRPAIDLRAMAIDPLRIARPALREAAKAASSKRLRCKSRIRAIG
jgi:hypothetical protein